MRMENNLREIRSRSTAARLSSYYHKPNRRYRSPMPVPPGPMPVTVTLEEIYDDDGMPTEDSADAYYDSKPYDRYALKSNDSANDLLPLPSSYISKFATSYSSGYHPPEPLYGPPSSAYQHSYYDQHHRHQQQRRQQPQQQQQPQPQRGRSPRRYHSRSKTFIGDPDTTTSSGSSHSPLPTRRPHPSLQLKNANPMDQSYTESLQPKLRTTHAREQYKHGDMSRQPTQRSPKRSSPLVKIEALRSVSNQPSLDIGSLQSMSHQPNQNIDVHQGKHNHKQSPNVAPLQDAPKQPSKENN